MSRARTELQQLTIDGGHEVVAILDKQPTWGGRRKGAGRPKTSSSSHSVTIRLSEYSFRCLADIASIRGETATATALHAVSLYIEMLTEEPELAEQDTIM